jgi:CRP-like cAMP-binding protein
MRAHGILKDVPDDVMDLISCCMTTYKFPAKHVIFLEGNPCNQVGSIRKGVVKLSKHLENGKTQIVGSAGPGFLLGYEAFRDQPFQSTVETLTEVEMCMATREEIVQQLRQFPDVTMGLVEFLCQRITDLERKTLHLGTFSARQRLAAYLLSASDPTDLSSNDESAQPNLNRQEIADTLGMAKETLIRLLTAFAEKGIVRLDGPSIEVSDPQKLTHMLSPFSR